MVASALSSMHVFANPGCESLVVTRSLHAVPRQAMAVFRHYLPTSCTMRCGRQAEKRLSSLFARSVR